MKNYSKQHFTKIIFSIELLFYLLILVPGYAQEDEAGVSKSRAYMGLEFSQSAEGHSLLASITARVEGKRGRQKVTDGRVDFYQLSDTAEVFLGNSTTDDDGKVRFVMEKDNQYYNHVGGELVFSAKFNGDGLYSPAAKQIKVRTVNMIISFEEIDSVRSIVVKANESGQDGVGALLEETVNFYVPRSFSMLKIGEGILEDGTCNIAFPVTLPGDTIGNLQIIARIEESDDYGNVEAKAVKDWGAARPRVVVEERRGLGDTDAPLWMVYTLIILLSAVWFHYLYVMYVFLQIKREGKSTGS